MNKTELIIAIADKSGIAKSDTEKALNAFVDVVTDALSDGDKVQLVGFGTFEIGKKITIPACKAPKFKAGKVLKEAVNK